jgi:hypothetical protein
MLQVNLGEGVGLSSDGNKPPNLLEVVDIDNGHKPIQYRLKDMQNNRAQQILDQPPRRTD